MALFALCAFAARAQEAVPSASNHEAAFPELTDWSAALQAAQETGKPLFVDAYTDWCGWCKVMDKKTFSLPAVKQFMNENMLCYRMDMEHNKASHNLRLAFGVNAFPTFVILNPDGTLMGKLVGYSDSAEWMKSLGMFLSEPHAKRPGIPAFQTIQWPDAIQAYADSDFEKRPEAEAIQLALTQCEPGSFMWFALAMNFSSLLGTQEMEYLLNHRESLGQQYGSDMANDLLQNALMRRLYALTKTATEPEFDQAIADFLAVLPADTLTALSMQVRFYKEKGNWKALVQILEKQSDEAMINSLSWAIYQGCDDQALLSRAAAHCAEYIASHSEAGYALEDTLAHLLAKLQRWDQAEAQAKRALGKATAEGEEGKETRELLQEIKAKRGL